MTPPFLSVNLLVGCVSESRAECLPERSEQFSDTGLAGHVSRDSPETSETASSLQHSSKSTHRQAISRVLGETPSCRLGKFNPLHYLEN